MGGKVGYSGPSLYWSWCWFLVSHPFACSNSFENFSTELKGYFCRWVVGSHWDRYIESVVVTSLHLPICTSVTSKMLQFFKFCLTRLHAQISSQVLRESDEIQGWFEVGCPGAQSLVCHDLGNALLGFLWKMEVPPVADIIALLFFPEFTFYSERNLWFFVLFFFQEASVTLTCLTNGSACDSPLDIQGSCVPSGATCCPHTSASVCLSSVCAVVNQWLVGLTFCATITLSEAGRKSEEESQDGKLQDVILKCLLLSNPTSFSTI